MPGPSCLPLILLTLALGACSTLSGEKRLAPSTLGCAQAVIASKVPAGLGDKRTHCIAAGQIARYCSVTEAYVAGVGKEIKDLFTPGGDAEWADIRADTAGVRCAHLSPSDGELESCCGEQPISR